MCSIIANFFRALRRITLIEVLVVISIGAILAAMFIPVIVAAKNNEKWQKSHPGEVYHAVHVGQKVEGIGTVITVQNGIVVINQDVE